MELKKYFDFKNPVHQIFPLKIVEEEKQDHFDLIFIKNSKNSIMFIFQIFLE